MTSIYKTIVADQAMKLGVDSENVLRKAEELLRLLQLRMSGANSIRQLTDPCRVLLCLNLACNHLNISFDKSEIIRLAGLSKKQYSNTLHLVEKLLNLTSPLNVNSLCVQLGVSEVAPHAERILKKYAEMYAKSDSNKRPLDLSFPMYHCVAVYLACKHNKVKVNKPTLIDAARIKRLQFDKLLEDFAPAVAMVSSSDVKKVATKRSHKLIELIDKYVEESRSEKEVRNHVKVNDIEESEEDFESWKKRILEEAYEDT